MIPPLHISPDSLKDLSSRFKNCYRLEYIAYPTGISPTAIDAQNPQGANTSPTNLSPGPLAPANRLTPGTCCLVWPVAFSWCRLHPPSL